MVKVSPWLIQFFHATLVPILVCLLRPCIDYVYEFRYFIEGNNVIFIDRVFLLSYFFLH